jgi:uncharacterized protein YjbI with pentapeptide repeats
MEDEESYCKPEINGQDFSSKILSGAYLNDAYCIRTSLSCCSLSNFSSNWSHDGQSWWSKFEWCIYDGFWDEGCNLTNADLTRTILFGQIFKIPI